MPQTHDLLNCFSYSSKIYFQLTVAVTTPDKNLTQSLELYLNQFNNFIIEQHNWLKFYITTYRVFHLENKTVKSSLFISLLFECHFGMASVKIK